MPVILSPQLSEDTCLRLTIFKDLVPFRWILDEVQYNEVCSATQVSVQNAKESNRFVKPIKASFRLGGGDRGSFYQSILPSI